ncbi:pur operon repressor [Microaerobacter geothermalis]|uniref:pur operon repressor n=1 Tax=Microaerobacter geothermalis TaxID=674972 RepID=UPI001F31392D|nr:pur operon repressor [Microaerobacter geothermalis]MCF6094704.1 pur operon repressor [Microaerobacter geothermalis]
MKKLRRSARLVEITYQLISQPHTLFPLAHFAERYESAKSSISEDLAIIKETFEAEGIGQLKTLAGAAGGVKYIPLMDKKIMESFLQEICHSLEKPERILPGGYLYMSDILGNPAILNRIGKIFASVFVDQGAEFILTVETKGIPLAYATAQYLQIPVVIVRRDNRVTEGSVVSINYISGSSKRIQTMSLARRALVEGAKVLIIDDFMKAGGTIKGIMDLLQEFDADVVGTGVFVEAEQAEERLVEGYVSLAQLKSVDVKDKLIKVVPGNLFH